MTQANSLLKNKVFKGTVWIIVLELLNQTLQFGKTFYAAKILTPSDFGVVGFAFLIVAGIEILSTTGMKEALIQKKEEVSTYLNTVWLIELGKGVTVFIILSLIAPIIIHAIDPKVSSIVINVTRFIGAIYFLQCIPSLGVLYFEKDVEFGKYFLYQISGTIVDVVMSIFLVQYLQNFWGLFFGVLAGTLTRTMISFVVSDFKPSLKFDKAKAKELFHFGKWIFQSRLFSFLGLQGDSIIVSTFFNVSTLGTYQMAFRIGNLPMLQVSNVITRIAFPGFSKVQGDQIKLKNFFLLTFSVLAAGLVPLVVFVFCFIDDFTLLVLGEKWRGIIVIVRILIISGFLRIFLSIIDSYFCAIGDPKVSGRLQMIRFAVFIVLAPVLGYYFGLKGIAFSTLISLFVVLLIFAKKSCRYLNISLLEFFDNWIVTGLFGVCAVLAILSAKQYFLIENIAVFIFALIIYATAYFGIGLLLDKLIGSRIFGKAFFLTKSFKSLLQ